MQQSVEFDDVTWPAVPRTVCTSPEPAFTPMCANIAKYLYWLHFLLGCTSQGRIHGQALPEFQVLHAEPMNIWGSLPAPSHC
jgi:hypothetical protein